MNYTFLDFKRCINFIFNKRIYLVFIFSQLVLTGCVSTASHKAISITQLDFNVQNSKLKGSFYIEAVTGGRVLPGWWTEVNDDEFKKALETSLATYGYLAKNRESSKYILNAEIVGVNIPSFGFDIEVTSSVYYKINSSEINKEILVVGNGVATMEDHFVAASRATIATERSLKNNIRNFHNQLRWFEQNNK